MSQRKTFRRNGVYTELRLVSLVVAGLVLGLLGAWGASRLLETLLYGVTASDPSTYLAVVAILITVGLAACYIPAREGSRVDPMTVLRTD